MASIDNALSDVSVDLEPKLEFTLQYVAYAEPAQREVTAVIALPQNAVVESYVLEIKAAPIQSLIGSSVAAESRVEEVDTGHHRVVLDFGQMRTINAVNAGTFLSLLTIVRISIWQGNQFGWNIASGGKLSSDVSTEKLLIEVQGTEGMSSEDILDKIGLRFADGPRDLVLQIDGTTVWQHPGTLFPVPDIEPETGRWTDDFRTLVDLTPALQERTGDPTASDAPKDLELRLQSATGGDLKITLPSNPTVRRIRRLTFASDTTQSLPFAEEGVQLLTLELPPLSTPRTLHRVTLKATAKPPPERVHPIVGPLPPDPAIVEFTLDAEHALCMRLPAGSGLSRITGVRLPLRALGSKAECRAVLWSDDDGPSAAIEDGVGDPLEIEASETPTWVTLSFPQPVDLDPEAPPWVALWVNRGQLILLPGAATEEGASAHIRRGAPEGPWLSLPSPLRVGELSRFDSPVRVVGETDDDAVTLVQLAVGDASVEVTPSAKGVPVTLEPLSTHTESPVLQVSCRAAADLDLSDIELLTSE